MGVVLPDEKADMPAGVDGGGRGPRVESERVEYGRGRSDGEIR